MNKQKIEWKLPLDFMLISVLLLMATVYIAVEQCVTVKWFYITIASIPVISFAVLLILSIARRLGKQPTIILSVVLVFVFIPCLMINMIVMSVDEYVCEINDESYYEKAMILEGYPETEELSFFPEVIPKSAESVLFYHTPMFTDEAQYTYLLITLPEEEIDAYGKAALEQNAEVYTQADIILQEINHSFPSMTEYLPGYADYPASIKYYVFDNVAAQDDGDEEYGVIYGIAVNESTSQILFYREIKN